MNAKDETINKPGFTVPEKFTPEVFDQLDSVITATLGREKLVTPDGDFAKIRELVKKGYVVRTRTDADTEEARNNDKTKFEAACRSGAQIITTDYYKKSTHFPSDYSISFEGGTYFRLNPLF